MERPPRSLPGTAKGSKDRTELAPFPNRAPAAWEQRAAGRTPRACQAHAGEGDEGPGRQAGRWPSVCVGGGGGRNGRSKTVGLGGGTSRGLGPGHPGSAGRQSLLCGPPCLASCPSHGTAGELAGHILTTQTRASEGSSRGCETSAGLAGPAPHLSPSDRQNEVPCPPLPPGVTDCVLQSPHAGNGRSRTAPHLLGLEPRGRRPKKGHCRECSWGSPHVPSVGATERARGVPRGRQRAGQSQLTNALPFALWLFTRPAGGAPRGRARARAEHALRPTWLAGSGGQQGPASSEAPSRVLDPRWPRGASALQPVPGPFSREPKRRHRKRALRGSLWNRTAHLSPSHRGPAPGGKCVGRMGVQPRLVGEGS